jgi:hypothetical protein
LQIIAHAVKLNYFSNLIDSALAALNTLKELGAALDNDADYAATIQKQLATKANVANVYTKFYIDDLISNYFTKQEKMIN